jgi:FtsZ-binding cell division protein ZapB
LFPDRLANQRTMKQRRKYVAGDRSFGVLVTIFIAAAVATRSPASEIDELKAQIQSMQKSMEQMQQKIGKLERENQQQKQQTAAAKPAQTGLKEGPGRVSTTTTTTSVDQYGNQTVTITPQTVTIESQASQITDRGALNDNQEPAPRPNNLTLDPKFRGFVPIPNTPVLIKFNAKPRVDFTDDPQNTGNPDRFVTAQIPVEGDFFKNGGNQFNVNSKGSQLSIDVRAPDIPGNPRFYYQNDFFGSGGGELPFRVRQLYGEIYNFVVGQTFSVFEDPDAWPDTVDYEGPNSAIFARRPLVRYQLPLNDHWQLNFGVEKPGAEVDTGIDPDAQSVNHAPDGGLNIRWEDSKIGHVQFGTILRDIGVKGPIVGSQSTFGWGLNLSGAFNLFERDSPSHQSDQSSKEDEPREKIADSLQAQVTYGHGLFRYFNDDFINNDAAFDSSGNLKAIPAFGAMIGYTHKWTDNFRSTVSYGYVELDNEFSQGPHAYHRTHYGSFNIIWQARKRLSIGLEGLYGHKEEKSGAEGDAFRLQVGLLYSIFD